jgi:HEAT repeat protein
VVINPKPAAEVMRRRHIALAGHQGDEATARLGLQDPSGHVRATAVGALQRMNRLTTSDVETALADPAAVVRRRACEASIGLGVDITPLLADRDELVVEAACFALGEGGSSGADQAETTVALSAVAADHKDPLCREAAVAALGALGAPGGLAAILAGLNDKPAVRRRAVIALASFEGPEVDEALARAREDRDWQVRQAAEDLS